MPVRHHLVTRDIARPDRELDVRVEDLRDTDHRAELDILHLAGKESRDHRLCDPECARDRRARDPNLRSSSLERPDEIEQSLPGRDSYGLLSAPSLPECRQE